MDYQNLLENIYLNIKKFKMGSFTDNTQALTQFNPYVQQLPVEAMVSVGQQKQQQYNEGVQKIQSHIDQIAGMDVVRDVDRQYLQSQLNNLGTNLKKVAAGDFSNYQLVNSVSGMASRIGKDANVRSAVASTARYRKGVSEMEAAIKEGKSSPSNEYAFSKQAGEWMNNPDIKASFTGGYTPYTNWKKNALEVIKALTKSESITEDAFTMDAKGNLVIADATVRTKMAGIPPDQIQQALMVGLTPADFKQLEVDGVYNYANLDAPRFQKAIATSHASTMEFYSSQKQKLENAKSTTTSVPEKQKLDEQIASLDRAMKMSNSEYQDVNSAIVEGNLDGAKARYFTRNALDGFSKAFSYTETSKTYVASPFAEAQRWRENKAMEWEKFRLNYEQTERHFTINKSLKMREIELKEQENRGYGGGLPVDVPQEDVPQYTLERVVQEVAAGELAIKSSDAQFMKQNGGDETWLAEQKAAWERNPKGVEPEIALHFSTTADQRRKLDADQAMIADISKQADERFEDISKYIPNDEPTTVWTDNGYQSFSPKDIVDYNALSNRYVKYTSVNGGTGPGTSKVEFDYDKAKQDLTPKQYRLFEAFARNKTPEDKRLVEAIQHYNKTVNQPYKGVAEAKLDYTAQEVTKRVSAMQGVEYGINTGKAELLKKYSTQLSSLINLANRQTGGLPNSPNFDTDTASTLMVDPKATHTMKVVEGTERQPNPVFEWTVSGEAGSVTARLTAEQKRGMFGTEFESTPQQKAIQPYKEQINKMGGYTTNLTGGKSTPDSAFLNRNDFPSVSIYGIKGDIIQPSPGLYAIKLNIYDPIKQIWVENISAMGSNMITENAILQHLQTLNDAAIYQILNSTDKAPTTRQMKEVEEASKKPF